jgi:voltage-gated potassium channel
MELAPGMTLYSWWRYLVWDVAGEIRFPMNEKNKMDKSPETEEEALEKERYEFLRQLEEWLEIPMVVLAFIWLILLIIEFIWGVIPLFDLIVTVIWIIFIMDFMLRFILAPAKLTYLRRNWLTALSLLLPALRIFQVARLFYLLRVARATRSLRLVRVIGTLNRGMRALRASLGRRGFSYVILLTIVVIFVGAAGMLAFENVRDAPGGFENYFQAIWWTAMLLTTLGSGYWPQTAEGQLLTFLLSTYALGILGYVTGALASFFIGRDAEDEEGELPSAKSVATLRHEIESLREEIRLLRQEI